MKHFRDLLKLGILPLFFILLASLGSCGGKGQISGMFVSNFKTTAVCDKQIKLIRMLNDTGEDIHIMGATIDAGTDRNGNFSLVSLFIGDKEIPAKLRAIENTDTDPLPPIPANTTYTWKIEFSPVTENSVVEAHLDISYEDPPGVVQLILKGASGALNAECAAAAAGENPPTDSSSSGGSSSGSTSSSSSSGGSTSSSSSSSGGTVEEGCTGDFADYCGTLDLTIDRLKMVTDKSTTALISSEKGNPSYTPFQASIIFPEDSNKQDQVIFPEILDGFYLPPPAANAGTISILVKGTTQVIIKKAITGKFDRTTGDVELPNIEIRLIGGKKDDFHADMTLTLTTKTATTDKIINDVLKNLAKFKITPTIPAGKLGGFSGTPLDIDSGKVVLVGVSDGFSPFALNPGDKVSFGNGPLSGNLSPTGEAALEVVATVKKKP